MSADHDPLTLAELDLLAALNRARTPGPLYIDGYICAESTGRPIAWGVEEADARALVAMANALPALLAEVRAARSAPSPSLAAALETYGRAYCRAAHLDTQARRTALADAEQALLAVIASDEERALWEGVEVGREAAASDDAPRIHIPADLLTRPAGGGVR